MRWSSVSDSERTFDGPIFPITREETDFGLPFGHVARGSSREAASCLLCIIHLNQWSPALGRNVLRPPLPALSAWLSGSLPFWFNSWLLILGFVNGLSCNHSRGRRVCIIDNTQPHSAKRTHLKRVAPIADYTFKATALHGSRVKGPVPVTGVETGVRRGALSRQREFDLHGSLMADGFRL